MKTQLHKQRTLNPAIPLVWLGLAVWGTIVMMSDSTRPGMAASPPAKWPLASKLPCPSQRPALLMFVHPHCAFSKASISQLSWLMSHCPGTVDAHVLFLCPSGRPTNWVQSDLWLRASAIPGVNVHRDDNGCETRLFRAETSGQVAFYGADGRLRFQGGLTSSGGQLGDDPGCAVLLALISHQPSKRTQTPVFGCRLFPPDLAVKK